MDFIKLSQSLGIDIDMTLLLIDTWIESLNEDVMILDAEISGGNLENVIASAHKIKGASAQLMIDDAAAIAREIEMKAKAGSLEGLENGITLLLNMRDEIIESKETFLKTK
ncbi:MAG TPA: Hpt domain-containing protein [Candidatus Wallbacteria bacterium]|nr:Hpt domain-containing protein [Candidatus Wallbacteria bacterium]